MYTMPTPGIDMHADPSFACNGSPQETIEHMLGAELDLPTVDPVGAPTSPVMQPSDASSDSIFADVDSNLDASTAKRAGGARGRSALLPAVAERAHGPGTLPKTQ